MSKVKCNTLETIDGTHSVDVKDLNPIPPNIGGLGMTGEVWVDELANRASDTEYTNNEGKPISVVIAIYSDESNGANAWVNVGGVSVALLAVGTTNNGKYSTVSVIVPPGSTYKLMSGGGSYGIQGWSELK